MTLYSRVRPLAFKLPAETAHDLGKRTLRAAQSTRPTRAALSTAYQYDHPALEVDLFDTTFPNPVGIAAGFDKNAEVTHALEALGFGFVEIGTVTPYSQDGNDRPRLFRLREDEAMVNRMGFNGQGMEAVKARLEEDGTPGFPLGVNIGKMNSSTEREAIEDYRRVFDRLSPFADYVVVNVSCPNTPDEFDEASPEHLREIFETIDAENDLDVPILVKIGPDEPEESILDLVDIVQEFDVDGIVATNTSTAREGLASAKREEWGGLSGKPVEGRSTAVIRTIADHTDGDLPIIGVGGVDSAASAYRKIRAGASLVQLYTGFVYQGPSTAKRINRGLVRLLERDGFTSIEEAVGAELE
ncbi:dihydroorotate dehydrogenase (quinone) [Natrialba magadii ATCC 43099]|uniref:Dihydroorotate dehydrogenase (quinone) n=1 Tax=Natrialba magadii (strain ATCC 43099 / DSM 3394 / CCM 3739 / CIP 104546 / IAM 13178 / JCM 8861 / NBRC 102185 / NCIMB 2190 / MS3) TaxID=547559 RepID=D3STE1_NATMM|nr:quinone-dependent dihydroorotate dehydrogenase [Natrialba magadii]ADD07008.1 dihydroorotate dehydrogenase (quinone) [Natrialba magadii ATCC 43099]ELY28849.1 dihydroorotate dehydrogenase 2 [Natrialba magadii ATCC 43099]